MKTNQKGIDLLHSFEGLRLEAYKDIVGVWTIGYGNTFYEDGSKVKEGDKITKERADQLFLNILNEFELDVIEVLKVILSNNQFSAITSFAYNLGIGNLRASTLLKKVNANPNDPSIRDEFMRWNRAGGKEVPGLTRRRKAEADLYFS